MSILQRSFPVLTAVVLVLAVLPAPARAQVPMRNYEVVLEQMFDAVRARSYAGFIAAGDERFKAGFTEKMFTDLAAMLGPRLEKGHASLFLTTLRQQDYTVYVWKVMFKDNKDDVLVSLFIRGGQVIGFVPR